MLRFAKYLVIGLFLIGVAGCKSSGMSAPSSGGDSFVAGGSGDTFGDFGGGSGGDGLGGVTGDGAGEDGALEVAVIHNPEPATMALWGIGLAGAALMRRKKRRV